VATAVGESVKGKVVSITKFGAFIELITGETGLCHISELSSGYVKTVEDHLSVGDEVLAKVIQSDKGKMSLSLKQTEPEQPQKTTSSKEYKTEKPKYRSEKPKSNYQHARGGGNDFESMLSSFIKNSDENLKGVKKQSKSRRGNGHQSGRD
jgi:S1 RNA binding domain protein